MNIETDQIPKDLKGPARLQRIKEILNLRQKDIATVLSLTESQVSLMLNGLRTITTDTANTLASVYGGTPDDFKWDASGKTSLGGLISGPALPKLLSETDILSGHESKCVKTSYVELHLSQWASSLVPGEDRTQSIDIQNDTLWMKFGHRVKIGVAEQLTPPSDVRSDLTLLPARVAEGFAPIHLTIPEGGQNFPRFPLEYWGEEPQKLECDIPFFCLSFTRI